MLSFYQILLFFLASASASGPNSSNPIYFLNYPEFSSHLQVFEDCLNIVIFKSNFSNPVENAEAEPEAEFNKTLEILPKPVNSTPVAPDESYRVSINFEENRVPVVLYDADKVESNPGNDIRDYIGGFYRNIPHWTGTRRFGKIEPTRFFEACMTFIYFYFPVVKQKDTAKENQYDKMILNPAVEFGYASALLHAIHEIDNKWIMYNLVVPPEDVVKLKTQLDPKPRDYYKPNTTWNSPHMLIVTRLYAEIDENGRRTKSGNSGTIAEGCCPGFPSHSEGVLKMGEWLVLKWEGPRDPDIPTRLLPRGTETSPHFTFDPKLVTNALDTEQKRRGLKILIVVGYSMSNNMDKNWNQLQDLNEPIDFDFEPEPGRRPHSSPRKKSVKALKKVMAGIFQDSVMKSGLKELVRGHLPNVTFHNGSYLLKRRFPRIELQNQMDLPHWLSNLIVLESEGISFISCDGISESTNLSVFSKPFQNDLWYFLCIFCAIVSTFVFWQLPKDGNNCQNFWNAIFLPTRSLLENYYQFTALFENVRWSRRRIKWVMGLWLIMGVVISNAYKGVVTSDVTAPKPKDFIQTFKQLLDKNYSLYTQALDDFDQWRSPEDVNDLWVKDKNGIVVKFLYPEASKVGCYPLAVQFEMYNTYYGESEYNKKHQLNLIYEGLLKQLTFQKNFPFGSIQQDVCECNKSAYFDVKSEILRFQVTPEMKEEFKMGKRPFMISSEEFGKSYLAWRFESTAGYGEIFWAVNVGIESGIQRFYQSCYDAYNYKGSLAFLNTTATQSFESLKFHSNYIQGFLHIVKYFFLAALIMFILEIIIKVEQV